MTLFGTTCCQISTKEVGASSGERYFSWVQFPVQETATGRFLHKVIGTRPSRFSFTTSIGNSLCCALRQRLIIILLSMLLSYQHYGWHSFSLIKKKKKRQWVPFPVFGCTSSFLLLYFIYDRVSGLQVSSFPAAEIWFLFTCLFSQCKQAKLLQLRWSQGCKQRIPQIQHQASPFTWYSAKQHNIKRKVFICLNIFQPRDGIPGDVFICLAKKRLKKETSYFTDPTRKVLLHILGLLREDGIQWGK